jgi:hypothetical protein
MFAHGQSYTFDRFANELHDGLADVGGEEEWPPDSTASRRRAS